MHHQLAFWARNLITKVVVYCYIVASIHVLMCILYGTANVYVLARQLCDAIIAKVLAYNVSVTATLHVLTWSIFYGEALMPTSV